MNPHDMYLEPSFENIQPRLINSSEIQSQWLFNESMRLNSDPQLPQQIFFSQAADHDEAPLYPPNIPTTNENLPNVGETPATLQVYIIPIVIGNLPLHSS